MYVKDRNACVRFIRQCFAEAKNIVLKTHDAASVTNLMPMCQLQTLYHYGDLSISITLIYDGQPQRLVYIFQFNSLRTAILTPNGVKYYLLILNINTGTSL